MIREAHKTDWFNFKTSELVRRPVSKNLKVAQSIGSQEPAESVEDWYILVILVVEWV